ncbi:MAG: TusE/DsrC/DsvC family sulfur relay protein [Pseudomonas sp.]
MSQDNTNSLSLDGKQIALDPEGFLVDLHDWSEPLAVELARGEGLVLTAEHMDVIRVLRQFYATYQLSPAMRPLVKYVGQQLGADKGTSLYLLKLFPGSPAKLASKLAGLPKPDNCL